MVLYCLVFNHTISRQKNPPQGFQSCGGSSVTVLLLVGVGLPRQPLYFGYLLLCPIYGRWIVPYARFWPLRFVFFIHSSNSFAYGRCCLGRFMPVSIFTLAGRYCRPDSKCRISASIIFYLLSCWCLSSLWYLPYSIPRGSIQHLPILPA